MHDMRGQDTPSRKAVLPRLRSELVGVRFRHTGTTLANSLEEQKERKNGSRRRKRKMKNKKTRGIEKRIHLKEEDWEMRKRKIKKSKEQEENEQKKHERKKRESGTGKGGKSGAPRGQYRGRDQHHVYSLQSTSISRCQTGRRTQMSSMRCEQTLE